MLIFHHHIGHCLVFHHHIGHCSISVVVKVSGRRGLVAGSVVEQEGDKCKVSQARLPSLEKRALIPPCTAWNLQIEHIFLVLTNTGLDTAENEPSEVSSTLKNLRRCYVAVSGARRAVRGSFSRILWVLKNAGGSGAGSIGWGEATGDWRAASGAACPHFGLK